MRSVKYIVISLVAMALMMPAATQATSVIPVKFVLDLEPGDVYEDVVLITNYTEEPIELIPDALNFKALATEPGTPWFYELSQPTDPRFAMADWLEFSEDIIALQPGETYNLAFTLRVPENASPGGHYGGILLMDAETYISNELEGETAGQVGVQSQTGPLFIIDIAGDVVKESSVTFSTRDSQYFFSSLPVDFVTTLDNQGSVHLQPFGDIILTSMFGNRRAAYPVNELDGFVLPESYRTFDDTWQWHELPDDTLEIVKEFKNFAFGRYTAELLFVDDPGGANYVRTVSFWVIPWQLIIVVVVLLLLLVGLVKLYNRMVVKRAMRRLGNREARPGTKRQ